MKHPMLLAMAILLVACHVDARSERTGETALPANAPINDTANASLAVSRRDEGVVYGGRAAAPDPIPSSSMTGEDPRVRPEEIPAEQEPEGNLAIRTRLLSVIDDASLETTFLHRVGSIAVRPDGSMVIAHVGERTLLWLDSDGRLLRSMGEQGDGPGDFRSRVDLAPELQVLPDGSVVAWEFTVQRFTFYSPSGELQSTRSLSFPGLLLGMASGSEAVIGAIVRPEARSRAYYGVDLESADVTWRWTGPPVRSTAIRFQSGTTADGRPRYANWSMPDCVPTTLAGAWHGRLLLVDAGAGMIHALPIDALDEGLPEEPLYRAEDRPRMNAAAERYVSGRLAAASPDVVEATLEEIVSEDGYLPVWKTLIVGSDGTLFLERAACGEQPDNHEWDVLSPEGERLGVLVAPKSSFHIRAGRRDRIVAVSSNSVGLERIEVHALEPDVP